jgi:hypothetical protein
MTQWVWLPGQLIPAAVLGAAADPECCWVAHNAAFERAMLEHILSPKYGWPAIPPSASFAPWP